MRDLNLTIGTGLLYPLNVFYEQTGTPLPQFVPMEKDAIPLPYRELLVHDNDMTPTLEDFHGQRIELELLMLHRSGDSLMREVALVTADDRVPVEFGAIRIELATFSREAQDLILGCRTPLGTILDDLDIEHLSRPSNFFRLTSDPVISFALNLRGVHELYGRRNTLSTPDGQTLADVVEVLAP